MRRVRDDRGVVVSWLLQIIAVVGVIGVVLFDAGSIAWNYFGVDSTADDIALELTQIEDGGTFVTPRLEAEARRLAREAGARLVRGSLQLVDDRLELEIRREATTIVVGRIDAISDWGKARATGSAPTS